MKRTLCCFILILVVVASVAQAQQAQTEDKFAVLKHRWTAILNELGNDRQAAKTASETQQVYVKALERLLADPELVGAFKIGPNLVDERTPVEAQGLVEQLAAASTKEKGAKSLNAASSNAAAPKVAERSGLTDLIALALDSQSFVSTDKTAVTISLNALAALGLNSETRSAPALYRQHESLRRLGGSFTFGAKLPEAEITGLTGLPSAETLFDVFGWDAKVRVFGDRDPRARKWYEAMSRVGALLEIQANLIENTPPADQEILAVAINDTQTVKALAGRLKKSAQVSFKAGGQHLTKEKGKNKYTFAVLADKGLANTDLTVNVAYSVVDDAKLVADQVTRLKTWAAVFGVNHLVGRDLFEKGRATELSLNANFELPVSDTTLPLERKKVIKIVAAVAIPWGASASIPVSVTYANDPNNLKKERYVTGHIGITYDFGALKSLFVPAGAK